MPWWVAVQLAFGLLIGVVALLPGVRGRRTLNHVAGDLACSACSALMLAAYYDIRVNAAIGGWVIGFFGYSLAWQIGFVAASIGTLESNGTHSRWDPRWILSGLTRLQLVRFAVFLLPALYLGGVVTARIWYPPPLSDPLTFGTTSTGAFKAKFERMIPLGSPINAAQDSLENHGFYCLRPPNPTRGKPLEVNCNSQDFGAESTLQVWQIILVHRHDSLIDTRIALTRMDP